jgi:hypothetical protein
MLNGMDVTDPYYNGKPLIYPDIYSFNLTQMSNAGHSPEAFSPGGYFNLITKDGGDQWHGSLSASFLNHTLQSRNISPALEREGLSESHEFNFFLDGNLQVSGPLIPKKLFLFSSASAFSLSRNLADYDQDDQSRLASGLLGLRFQTGRQRLHLLWSGQNLAHPSFGAGRHVPFSATTNRRERFNVFQAIWESWAGDQHHFRAGVNYARADTRSVFQNDISQPNGIDIFSRIQIGSAPEASQNTRKTLSVQFRGESVLGRLFQLKHRIQYGFQIQRAASSSRMEIRDNTRLQFYKDKPLAFIRYNTPLQHHEAARHLSFFAQDTLTLSSFLSFYAAFLII